MAGVHTGRVIAAGAGLLALGGIAWLLMAGEPAPEPPRRALDVTRQSPAPALPRYEDLSVPAVAAPPVPPNPVEPPRPRFDPTTPIGPSPTQAAPDRLAEQARAAGVGGWSRPREEEGGRTPGDPAGSDGLYPGAMAGPDSAAGMTADTTRGAGQWGHSQTPAAVTGAATCHVPAGTPIPLQTLNRVVTEQGGILVTMVTRDVLGNGLTCRAIPAGSTVTLSVAPGSARGRRRIAVADPVITRPWPWADSIRPAAVAADTTGAAGLPGRVQVPWLSTGLLIAAGTATDLATAALSDGGSLIGPILGRTADRPLDQATRALLDRLPVITLEPGAGMTLLLAGPLVIRAW
ncbi:TrbI/VirB10 family protein [Rhodocista pekingensis]|uniref:TrbI/VirB10 family protein n=1 Tax=Rhodocista pekingensis TaxID=201185 RepID=A0ABW2KX57_9PROT